MKYFLLCLFGGLSIHAGAQTAAEISEIQITDSGTEIKASTTASIEGRSYSCSGVILMSKFSVLSCGDQRQAQIEIQTFVEDTKALVAFYESGRQSGSLYVFEKSEKGYASSGAPAIFTPGFGSLDQFQMYVIAPIRREASESSAFIGVVEMMKAAGSMSLSEIRDRVVNREYRDFLPIPTPTERGEQPWDKLYEEEAARIEMARISEEMRVAEVARKAEEIRVAAEKKAAEELAAQKAKEEAELAVLEAQALSAQKALEEARAKTKTAQEAVANVEPKKIESTKSDDKGDKIVEETPVAIKPTEMKTKETEKAEEKKAEERVETKKSTAQPTVQKPKIQKPAAKTATAKKSEPAEEVVKTQRPVTPEAASPKIQVPKTSKKQKAEKERVVKTTKTRKPPVVMRGDDPFDDMFDDMLSDGN